MNRGALKIEKSELVALWVPKPLLRAVDRAVNLEDSDRSKFIRRAVRNHVKFTGIPIEEAKEVVA